MPDCFSLTLRINMLLRLTSGAQNFEPISVDEQVLLSWSPGERTYAAFEQRDGANFRQFRMFANMYTSRVEDLFGNYVNYNYIGDQLTWVTQVTAARSVSREVPMSLSLASQRLIWAPPCSAFGSTSARSLPPNLPCSREWCYPMGLHGSSSWLDWADGGCLTRSSPVAVCGRCPPLPREGKRPLPCIQAAPQGHLSSDHLAFA